MSTNKPRLAYLTTLYPALSHTFIEREVRGLREMGFEIHTFSVRRPTTRDVLGSHHRDAERETYYLLDASAKIPVAILWALICNPVGLVRAVFRSQQVAGSGLLVRFRHLAYALESVTLARRMSKSNLRHVHVHLGNNGASVALLACVFDPRLSYSLSVHGPGEFAQAEQNTLKPRAEYALFVRCISDFCKSQVMARTDPSAWKNFHVVHCGVDPETFVPAPAPVAKGDDLRIITVGRLVAAKGFPILLQACAFLAKEKISWRLEVVGDGEMMRELRDMAGALGISDQVKFSGPVSPDEVSFRLQQADLMVLPSFQEGVPVVLMEAMAKEIPVISTTVAGIPELIESGKEGLLVHPGSVELLAEALKDLARDSARRRRFGKAGRQKVIAEFAIAGTCARMKDLFTSYLR